MSCQTSIKSLQSEPYIFFLSPVKLLLTKVSMRRLAKFMTHHKKTRRNKMDWRKSRWIIDNLCVMEAERQREWAKNTNRKRERRRDRDREMEPQMWRGLRLYKSLRCKLLQWRCCGESTGVTISWVCQAMHARIRISRHTQRGSWKNIWIHATCLEEVI